MGSFCLNFQHNSSQKKQILDLLPSVGDTAMEEAVEAISLVFVTVKF